MQYLIGRREFVLVVVMVVIGLAGIVPGVVSAQGNRDAAHACRDGGFAAVVGVTNGVVSAFANEGACVRYAAQGGLVVQASLIEACLDGDHVLYTTTEGGDPFESEADCVAFVVEGGTLVPVVFEDPLLARCREEALVYAGISNTSGYNVVLGTEGDDDFAGRLTGWGDLVCGFGGDDTVAFAADGNYHVDTTIREGDVFLGGEGNDSLLQFTRLGVFYGGSGEDFVSEVHGPFYGGAGNDSVRVVWQGVFYGGDDDDYAFSISSSGTFYGELGADTYEHLTSGGVFVQD